MDDFEDTLKEGGRYISNDYTGLSFQDRGLSTVRD
jgi:hypothetical protein